MGASMGEPAFNQGNIFAALPADRGAEHFDTLVKLGDGRVERIVSFGQCSPEGFWYDQDHHEWVIVLRGRGTLQIEGRHQPIDLGPGDYIELPARTRHRVAWTTAEEPTIWLAVHHG